MRFESTLCAAVAPPSFAATPNKPVYAKRFRTRRFAESAPTRSRAARASRNVPTCSSPVNQAAQEIGDDDDDDARDESSAPPPPGERSDARGVFASTSAARLLARNARTSAFVDAPNAASHSDRNVFASKFDAKTRE